MGSIKIVDGGKIEIMSDGVIHMLPCEVVCIAADEIRRNYAPSYGFDSLREQTLTSAISDLHAMLRGDVKFSYEKANKILIVLGGEPVMQNGSEIALFNTYAILLVAKSGCRK